MEVVNKAEVKGKMVFVRVDFNVPLDENGNILSYNRINSAVHTINFLLKKGAKIVLCSHLGRPKGQVVPAMSLQPVFKYLKSIYGEKVFFCPSCIGEVAENMKNSLKPKQILLLENVRFNSGEESCDENFVAELARGIDIFVDEAFATSHRKEASNFGMSQVVPAYVGFEEFNEQKSLSLKNKKQPILAILGGAKVSDKIGLITSLVNKVQSIYIGGAMAFTFLKAKGENVGTSLVDDENIETAKQIMQSAEQKNVKIYLPIDVVVAQSEEQTNTIKTVDATNIEDNLMGLDIGEKSIVQLINVINESKTIFWNGPLGVYNVPEFEKGSKDIAYALSKSKAYTICGGGDTIAVIEKYGLNKKINFVSTGGGASLNYIQKE